MTMKKEFRKRLSKTIGILLAIFVALFIFRLVYGYNNYPTSVYTSYQTYADGIDGLLDIKRNYASEKYEGKSSSRPNSPIQIDQKYEKIAEISSTSTKFESDEILLRKSVDNYKSLIQFEQKSGNEGNRTLSLLIGVPPEHFDNLYIDLIAIGTVETKQITKKDKTNEYKELNAKKMSLEKIRASLIELKTKGGRIDEYMQLENRILEIEQQLQSLGVSLGDFDEENEFCTIQFSMTETVEVKISLMHRIKVALEWTIERYLIIMATLCFLTLFAYLLLVTSIKVKAIINDGKKINLNK